MMQTNPSDTILLPPQDPWLPFFSTIGTCALINIPLVLYLKDKPLSLSYLNTLPLFDKLLIMGWIFLGGLFLIGTLYSFLSLFNPKATLTIKSSALIPGNEYILSYQFTGNTQRISKLTLYFIGKEKIKCKIKNKSHYQEHIFYHKIFHQTKIAKKYDELTFTIDKDLIPSFFAPHNKIEWQINVVGNIPLWPDLDEEYILLISQPIQET